MKIISTLFFLAAVLLTSRSFAGDLSQVLRHAPQTKQLLLVVSKDKNTLQAVLQRYTRKNDGASWQKVGTAFPVVLGKNGLAWDSNLALKIRGNDFIKQEGDGRAPAGIFAIGDVFAFDKASTKMPFFILQKDTVCVDDPNSIHYNHILLNSDRTKKDWNSSEQMREEALYDTGIVVQYNAIQTQKKLSYAPNKKAGSCIFMHIWRSSDVGTAGCTAMEKTNLVQLIQWLIPENYPVLVQVSQNDLQKLQPVLLKHFKFKS